MPKWKTTSWFNPLCDEAEPAEAAGDELGSCGDAARPRVRSSHAPGLHASGLQELVNILLLLLQAQRNFDSSLHSDPMLRSTIAIQSSGLCSPTASAALPSVERPASASSAADGGHVRLCRSSHAFTVWRRHVSKAVLLCIG